MFVKIVFEDLLDFLGYGFVFVAGVGVSGEGEGG